MITRGKFWNAYYRGWFAARSDRPQPASESMVEHSFVVDGYLEGKSSGGSAASTNSPSNPFGTDASPSTSDESDSSKQESEPGSESAAESESSPEAVDNNAEAAE